MAKVTTPRGGSEAVERFVSSRAVLGLVGFLAITGTSALVADTADFPVVAGLIVAFGFLVLVVTVLFVILPISALTLLD